MLALGWRTGSRIAAEREAWRLGREFSAQTEDGRPDGRILLRLKRGSGALLAVLEKKVREGPFEERAGIARALGCSGRIECLPELVAELRDGCVDPEAVVIGGRPEFPLRVLPPDELVLNQETRLCRVAEDLALESEDPFTRGWAKTHLAATATLPSYRGAPSESESRWKAYWLDAELIRLVRSDNPILHERAARVLARIHSRANGWLSKDGREAAIELAAPTPEGRLVARVLVTLGDETGGDWIADRSKLRALSDDLTDADLLLARDPLAVARATRALARGELDAAATLALLAARDPAAREALVASLDSSVPADVRAAAAAALDGLPAPAPAK
jgi:hypothetical protein